MLGKRYESFQYAHACGVDSSRYAGIATPASSSAQKRIEGSGIFRRPAGSNDGRAASAEAPAAGGPQGRTGGTPELAGRSELFSMGIAASDERCRVTEPASDFNLRTLRRIDNYGQWVSNSGRIATKMFAARALRSARSPVRESPMWLVAISNRYADIASAVARSCINMA